MKKTLITLVILIILGALWYFVSPLFINKTIDEEFVSEFESLSEEDIDVS